MFTDMSDWCMSKDYNGAERFNDGKRPLMAETEFADIIICGIPGKNEVAINVSPYNEDGGSFDGEATTKEQAEKIGADIINYINSNIDGSSMFTNGDFKDFFSSLPLTNIHTDELVEDTGNKDRRIEQKPPIRAHIANADDVAAMFSDINRLKDGNYSGAWHNFPTTTEKIQAALKEIGVDGVKHKAYYITDYETDIPGLREHMPVNANIDELNYLAVKRSGMGDFELDTFCAALEYSVFRDGLADIINTAENLHCFDLQPAYSEAEYGKFLSDMESDSFGIQIEMLEESDKLADRELAAYIYLLEKHFNTESYGCEKVKEEGGCFTKHGYLIKRKALQDIYIGLKNIPAEYRVSVPPNPQERPSALDRLAVAKNAVARTDAEKPPADRAVKSSGAEL